MYSSMAKAKAIAMAMAMAMAMTTAYTHSSVDCRAVQSAVHYIAVPDATCTLRYQDTVQCAQIVRASTI
jgi:hypothetical protein